METINTIGADPSRLSMAIALAESARLCRLVSLQHSERVRSVLAEGDINRGPGSDEVDEPPGALREQPEGRRVAGRPGGCGRASNCASKIVRMWKGVPAGFPRDPFEMGGGELYPAGHHALRPGHPAG